MNDYKCFKWVLAGLLSLNTIMPNIKVFAQEEDIAFNHSDDTVETENSSAGEPGDAVQETDHIGEISETSENENDNEDSILISDSEQDVLLPEEDSNHISDESADVPIENADDDPADTDYTALPEDLSESDESVINETESDPADNDHTESQEPGIADTGNSESSAEDNNLNVVTARETDELEVISLSAESGIENSEKDSLIEKCSSDYGYQDIIDHLGSEEMKVLYEDIDSIEKNFFKSSVDLDAESNYLTVRNSGNLSNDEIMQVYTLYRYDHPLYYWMDQEVIISDDYIGLVCSKEYISSAVRETCYTKIISAIQEYSDYCEGSTSNYTYATAVLYMLVQRTDYAYSDMEAKTPETSNWAHNIMGVFDEDYHEAVCEGYAKAYQLLLNYFGVPNIYVVGNASGNTGEGQEAVLHAWNLVQMDNGNYYWADPTWSDIDLRFDYFNHVIQTDLEIHDRNRRSFDYPFRVRHLYHLKGIQFCENHWPLTEQNTGSLYLYALPASSSGDYVPNIIGYPQISDPGIEGFGIQTDPIPYINGDNLSFIVLNNDGIHREVEVTSIFLGNDEDIFVPSEIEFKGVKYKVAGFNLAGVSQYTKNITIGEGVRYLRDTLSTEIMAALSINIPASVEYIRDPMIIGPTINALQEINVDDQNPYIKDIDGVLFSKDEKTLLRYPPLHKAEIYTIPDGTNSIFPEAFSGTQNTQQIIIPQNVNEIGIQAFEHMKSVEYIEIPSSIKKLPENVFYESNIKSIYVSAETSFNAVTFAGIDGLEEIIIEEGSPYGFVDDGGLYIYENGAEVLVTYPSARVADSFTIRDGARTDGATFEGVYGLKKVIIPEHCNIHWGAFFRSGVESLEVDENNRSIKYENGAVFNYDKDILITYLAGCKNKSYIVPDGVKEIVEFAFSQNPYIEDITVSDSVERIYAYAFDECSALKKVKLSKNVRWSSTEWISNYPDGIYLFEGCGNLTNVEIPHGVTYLPYGMFDACFKLKYVVLPDTLEIIGGNCNIFFPYTDEYSLTDIYYYGTEEQWNAIDHGGRDDSLNIDVHFEYDGSDIEDLTSVEWTVDNSGTLVISGTENIPAYKKDGAPWSERKEEITRIIISEGTASIGKNAFSCLKNVSEVILPETVKSLGNGCFSECESLEMINIPDALESIDSNAFFNTGLKSFTVPDTVTYLGEDVFANCYQLNEVSVETELSALPSGIFHGCRSLEKVILPDSVKVIGSRAFHSCNALKTIELPPHLEVIESNAFYECVNLYSLMIPDTIQVIGEYAFYMCVDLKRMITYACVPDKDFSQLNGLILPDKEITFGAHTFDSCGFETVTLPNGVKELPAGLFNQHRFSYLYIPESVETIGEDCIIYIRALFSDNPLKQLVIPRSVTSLGQNVSDNDTQLFVYPGSKAEEWAKMHSLEYTAINNKLAGWTWSEDYSSAYADVADHNGEITKYEAVVTDTVSDENGITVHVYTAAVTADTVRYQDVRIIKSDDHNNAEITYSWSSDNSSVTASAEYKDESLPPVYETVSAEYEVIREPSCTESGAGKYTAVFENDLFETQIKEIVIEPTGHEWQEPEWTWSEDYETAAAVFICAHDKEHTAKVEATITSERVEPTEEKDGSITYTAAAVFNDAEYTDRKVITIPAEIHEYKLTGIRFAEKSIKIGVHEEYTLTVIYEPENTTDDKTVTWTSSDENVVTVDETGKLTGAGLGTATVTATTADGRFSAECNVTVAVYAESMTLSVNEEEILHVGETLDVDVTFIPEGASEKLIWTSSDETVAAVDENGVVTALKSGEAIISAESEDSSLKESFTLIVAVDVTGIALDQTEVTLTITGEEKESVQLIETLSPENATIKDVRWTSSDESVVTVNEETGYVTAVNGGTAVITATTVDGGHTAECRVTVVVSVTGVMIYEINEAGEAEPVEEDSLYAGEERKFTAKVLPENATNQNIIWESSDPEIASVDEEGTVKALQSGETVISATAEDGESFDDFKLTVYEVEAESIETEEEHLIVPIGTEKQIVYKVLPENTTNKKVVFESEDEEIATVSEEGVLKGLTRGTVTVTLSTEDGKISQEITVEVVPDGIYMSEIERTYEYTGTAIKPEVKVYDRGTELTSADYTVTYANNTNAGTATITIKMKGNYSGTVTENFEITPIDLSEDERITSDALTIQATGKTLSPVPSVYFNGTKLKKGTDFDIDYGEWETRYQRKEAGDWDIVLKGKGNYTGEYDFTVHAAERSADIIPVTKLKITAKTAKYQDLKGEDFIEDIIDSGIVTIKKGTELLAYNDDYEISEIPEDYKQTGTLKFTITGVRDYYGDRTITVKITGISINDKKVKIVDTEPYVYTGEEQELHEGFHLTYDGVKMDQEDYEILEETYTNNLKVGTASVKIEGRNGFTGTKTVKYKITANKESITEKDVAVEESTSYAKGGAKAAVEVYDDELGLELVEGTDYTLKYTNNKKVGENTAKVTVTFKGNFKGTPKVEKLYSITPKEMCETTLNAKDIVYTGKAGKYKSTPVITDTDGKTLKAGTDYEKAYVFELENEDGTYTLLDAKSIVEADSVIRVTVTGKGNYTTEQISTEYRILKKGYDISKAVFTIESQVYTGEEIEVDETAITKAKINKTTDLKFGTDYEIVEGSYKNNIKKGTASVVLRGLYPYGGTKTVKFKIIQKPVEDYWQTQTSGNE